MAALCSAHPFKPSWRDCRLLAGCWCYLRGQGEDRCAVWAGHELSEPAAVRLCARGMHGMHPDASRELCQLSLSTRPLCGCLCGSCCLPLLVPAAGAGCTCWCRPRAASRQAVKRAGWRSGAIEVVHASTRRAVCSSQKVMPVDTGSAVVVGCHCTGCCVLAGVQLSW